MALLTAFNPHELTAATVLGLATGREEPLDEILSIIRNNIDAPTKQHVIVSAPRGYGKSFFLRYVQVKLDEVISDEKLPIAMALLPEELPHVKEPDTLIAEIRRVFLKAPANTVSVRWVEDDGDAWDEAVAELDAAIEERFIGGRGLLIAGVENFDLLLKKAFGKNAQAARLREFLTRQGNRVMLLTASARGAFDRDYDAPLFKMFHEVELKPWSIDQCLDFFASQRAAAGKSPLTKEQQGKVKAVATFIGGTPRLATLLGDALLENDPMRAADLLERLIDELTPYYKERIEVLPSRSQALLDTLLRGGERCSATELARRAGAPNQPAIAGPLDELKKDLVVTGEKAPDSAEVLLRVTDRVFAHYYRKRILSHGQEMCPLEALVELLATFYSPDEKKQEAEKLAARGLAREAAILERLWQADQQQRATGVVVAGGTNKDAAIDAEMARWWTAAEEGRFADGLLILDGILKTARAAADVSREVIALNNRAWTLNELRMHEAALTAANEAGAKAVDIDDLRQHALALRISAFSLGQLGRHEEAIETARESVTKAKSVGESRGQAIALRHLAWNLGELGRHIEAIETARKAAAIAEMAGNAKEQTRALRTGAACLRELGRHNEAIEIAREAAVIAKAADDPEEQADAIRNVAISLSNLGRHSEAIATACDAAAIAERAGDTWEQVHIAALLLLEHANLDVEVALKSFLVLVRHANSVAATYPALFFSSIARIATRRMVWPKLTDLLSNSPAIANEIAEKSESLAEPANAIVAAHESGPRESALDETRHLVAALSQAVETATDPRLARLWTAVIHSSADRLATKIDDPDLLRDLANIMAAHPAVAARAAQLLAAAAAYHTAERDPSTLARLDPDLATTLTTVFPPKSGAAKQVRKSQKRKRPKG